jgi:ABC-2 type transport system ATP-binding protein
MDEAERLCDRLVVIDGGRVVAEGTPSALIEGIEGDRGVRLRFADAAARAHAGNLLTALADRDGDVTAAVPVGDEIEVTGTRKVLFAIVQALAAADVVPDDVRTVERTLEDVFVQVTGREYRAEENEEVAA